MNITGLMKLMEGSIHKIGDAGTALMAVKI